MAHYVVSTPALGFSAAAMTEAAATLDMQISQAQAVINSVVGGSWVGDAADEFLKEWTAFVSNASATRTALISIATRLHGAQGAYETTESQNVTSMRSSRVGITQPGRDGRLGTADDEKTRVTLAESVADSRDDLRDLDIQISQLNRHGGAGA